MNDISNWLENALPKLRALVADERRIGVEILDLLAECERRKAYTELGHDGLFSFCVKVLLFTEAQAFQRIQAMRAMRATPELKSKIESGVMSVSTVAQVQGLIRKERAQGIQRTASDRRELFARFENKTAKEVKREIALVMGDRIKVRITLELDEEAELLWRELKEKSAHQTGGDELNLMKMLMKQWLGKKDSVLEGKHERVLKVGEFKSGQVKEFGEVIESNYRVESGQLKTYSVKIPNTRRDISWSSKVGEEAKLPSISSSLNLKKMSRRIPISLQRQVYQRDLGKCMNCGSKYALTIDHIVPFAKVRTHELSNLRLLCRNCNLGHGVKQFGLEAMKR
ncbi:MAG: HNH endonuclease [Xanthomonadaceae bacterium]|nr:HNH endonuclease [Xanthomonadaceae bacterium]